LAGRVGLLYRSRRRRLEAGDRDGPGAALAIPVKANGWSWGLRERRSAEKIGEKKQLTHTLQFYTDWPSTCGNYLEVKCMFPALLLQVLLVLLIVGVVLWGISQIPMDPAIARMIRVVVIVVVAIWLIYLLFGVLGAAGPIYHR